MRLQPQLGVMSSKTTRPLCWGVMPLRAASNTLLLLLLLLGASTATAQPDVASCTVSVTINPDLETIITCTDVGGSGFVPKFYISTDIDTLSIVKTCTGVLVATGWHAAFCCERVMLLLLRLGTAHV